jgi:mobilome CxxCx(11)CxxC protein
LQVRNEETDRTCATCWDKAAECFGTSQIFLERASLLQKKLNLITYLGIAMPALIGCLALSFGTQGIFWAAALFIAGIVGVLQLGMSIGALVGNWSNKLDYFRESAFANLQLSEEFKRLGETASSPPVDLRSRCEALLARELARVQQDSKHDVSPMELRKAHRHGLRQFQRKCAGCDRVPTDLQPSTCNVCGNFK